MSRCVIDANIGLALVVPLAYSERVHDLVHQLHRQRVQLSVPALWGCEVASGLRKAAVSGFLTDAEAREALFGLWALGLEEIPASLDRHVRALAWAKRLGQSVAYDAQYLVVAEELGAPLWTADRRLAVSARDAGAAWVRWIEDGA
jgi:predicted nucleic acid-binding protein